MSSSNTPTPNPAIQPGVSWKQRLSRAPLLMLAMLFLVTGVWGGLVRLMWSPVPLTSFNVNWVSFHGPLMVSGFLGTLIGVERAVAVGRWWAFPGPMLTAAGGLMLIAGVLGKPVPVAFVLGSVCLLSVVVAFAARWPSTFLVVMACGNASWLVGNLLWLQRWPIHRVVPWWMGFLLLTIVAERLELSRFLQPNRWQHRLFLTATATFLGGLVVSTLEQKFGEQIAGIGMFALAFWLLRNDIARRTIRQPGLPRFTAACLLSGYVWLAIAGLGLLFHSPLPKYGPVYDSVLHIFFLGFVFAMIFGHAPIIFPAVLNISIPFRRRFYAHVVLLQLSLVLRIVGDTCMMPYLNGWGGLLNAAAIVLFVFSTVTSAASSAFSGAKSQQTEVAS